ncbi:hypothetical protein N825_00285 [Skermanella stibiiresistens SB22]|uniref:Uncharacterized protein n=1 Tax=Skermanella stibiiresistens SB22 TaxID=1385369 RepID=W9HFV5_9PROT|nr:hypothetical protein N825_00285 [Skermanella stibiiresistens SB22]
MSNRAAFMRRRLDSEEKTMRMPRFRALTAGLTCAMIAFGTTGAVAQTTMTQDSPVQTRPTPPATKQDAVTAPAPPEAGFDVIVLGVMKGSSPEDFSRQVIEALPAQLKDPQTNFTSGVGFKRDKDYRMVIAFHGEEMVEASTLCTSTNDVAAVPPPENSDLMAATRITAAFCDGGQPLNTATDRMVGSVSPGQAGFRFMVSDVAKQLFPDGFGTIPGTISAQPPGTMVRPIE